MSASEDATTVAVVAVSAAGLRYAARTDVGCEREHNEDSHRSDAALGLWLVADGMGGQGGGDVASRIVVTKMVEACRAGLALPAAVEAAHAAVVAAGGRGEGSAQMGSTIVALRSDGLDYEIAWVGDSRAYLWDGELRLLTRDHSVVQERIDHSLISAADRANDPGRGVLTQCLGPANKSTLVIGSLRGRWHRREKILLSSDGLHEEVPETTISAIVSGDAGLEQSAGELIEAARRAGGPDNITAILVAAPPAAPHPPLSRCWRRLGIGPRAISLTLGAGAGLLVAGLMFWLLTR